MVILVDDEDRENEGDLTMAAEKVTPEAINFMTKQGRGLICLSLTPERCDQLNLSPMVSDNTSPFGTGFTVSIDAMTGVTTGISASDRAATILKAIEEEARPNDFARPGHTFPLRSRKGGVLVRTGQTEGSVDLAILAGLKPAGVICEIMNEDGTMARLPDLERFSSEHRLPIVMIKDLVSYRMQNERLVRKVEEAELPTDFGTFRVVAYENEIDRCTHVALVMGKISPEEATLVRVHS
jgi:3,4-dihydroxy 2-butanone 4-phosphate synthase/GTP cyclohydrolase II